MIAAYCWPQSAEPGQTIELFCHTEAHAFQIEVIRQGAENNTVLQQNNIRGTLQPIADVVAEEGCGWNPSCSLRINPTWPSGLYLIRLTTCLLYTSQSPRD